MTAVATPPAAGGDTVCPLCAEAGGQLVWQNALCRVIDVEDPDYPGFFRVVLNRHCAEMSDLAPSERDSLMRVVYCVEAVLREALRPDKINLASLGNVVPHLHWHVIPRWRDDRHFPNPIWGEVQRAPIDRGIDRADLRQRLVQQLTTVV